MPVLPEDRPGAPVRALVAAPDVRVFLGRLTRLDPAALVRLRPVSAAPGVRTGLWARLPWGALATREVAQLVPEDLTVGAAELLRGEGVLPPRRDAQWRWPLPPPGGEVLEEVPAERLREIAAAAADTLREVSRSGVAGRAVGSRRVREALLDHVPLVVEVADARVEVSQRLVQAVLRMGFLGDADDPVRVRRAGRWVGLAARFGTAWSPPPPGPLTMRPI